MRVLVMGGTSFVGKCFAMHAVEKGYTVDIFTRGNAPVDYDGVNKHLKGDRKNIEDVEALVTESYDYVVDFSAYFMEDIKLLTDVLDRSNLKRYVMCSTVSVYAMPKPGVAVDEEYDRSFDNHFGGDYGENKRLAEEHLMGAGIPYTIFRPTYIYGEYNYVYREAYLFESIEKGLVNSIEDKCIAQFVYVKDLVKTFESCLQNEKSIDQAYNVTNPSEVKWSDWVEAGFFATGKRADVCIHTDEMLAKAGKPVFPFVNADIYFSIEKLQRDGLYIPSTDIKQGFSNAYKWYKGIDPSYVTRGRF